MKHSRMVTSFALLLAAPALLLAQAAGKPAPADPWDVDPAHSAVAFRVKHLGMTWVNGNFKDWTAELRWDPEHPENSSVTAQLKTAGVTTGNDRRDNDLRANYLAVDSFPAIRFVSRAVRVVDREHLRISGDLTIRGVTRPVVLDTEIGGTLNGPRGPKVAFSATTAISRRDFGMLRNPLIEGVGVVGDEVRITIDIEAGLANP